MVDVVYIAACAHDARFARICLASVRLFCPDVPIRLLPGGKLSRSLVCESRKYWGAEVADIPLGDYGWGFVKLEPLFGPQGERFLVLDSDTVLTGPILNVWLESGAPFLVNDEKHNEADVHCLYYDWQKVRAIDAHAHPPQFVFNSGQWFGTAGVLTREDFSPWVEWTKPRRLRHPQLFMPGDQGILNYILNQKVVLQGLRVERRQIMCWPGQGMEGLDMGSVSQGRAPALVVHWAGLKKPRLRDMTGADLLFFFEEQYYQKIPAGAARRFFRRFKDFLSRWLGQVKLFLSNKAVVQFSKNRGANSVK